MLSQAPRNKSNYKIYSHTLSFLSQSIPHFSPSSISDPEVVQPIGVLPGEGIGEEVIEASLKVLNALTAISDKKYKIYRGGLIGNESYRFNGRYLSDEVIGFCREIFKKGGALFCGPGGGRFVYELRSHFDLFCKFTPLKPINALKNFGIIQPQKTQDVDIITVRENTSGLYFGDWSIEENTNGGKKAVHKVSYKEHEIDRILKVAIGLAENRRGKIVLALKKHGFPAISRLWEERARQLITENVELTLLEIDNAVYQLIANASNFDVIVTPNMFGDILADCGALLLGSRGMSFSGNFGSGNKAVYQTGHGAALDIAGTDKANPIGQIMSLAMMLRESYCWPEGAAAIENAVHETLLKGYRTEDIANAESEIIGTQEMAEMVCQSLRSVSFIER